MAIPVSLAAAALPKALYALGKLPRWGARLLYLALDSFATALGLAVVDMLYMGIILSDYERFSRNLDRSGQVIADRGYAQT